MNSKKIIKDIVIAKKELRHGKFYTFEKVFGKLRSGLKKVIVSYAP